MLRIALQILQRILARVSRLRVRRGLTLLIGVGGGWLLLLLSALVLWVRGLTALLRGGHGECRFRVEGLTCWYGGVCDSEFVRQVSDNPVVSPG